MQNANYLKSYLHLHLIVFIWGFTAILGDLISVKEEAVVWYRMLLAGIFMLLFILLTKKDWRLSPKSLIRLFLVGLLIALHWVFFFKAINVSNVSITLAVFSTGAFFASILEPIFFNRKMLWYEVFFGIIIVGALLMILQVEQTYILGMAYALLSVFLGVIFTLFNGKLIQKYDPSVITLYEFFAGAAFISIYLLATQKFTPEFFNVSLNDWLLIIVLASICTAYAFTASVNVMKRLSPYTVMLTTNLEPVYGIALAFFILGEKEKMSFGFYIGAIIILTTVILNGILKNREKLK
ncbi:EamA family transporter [Flavobacterium sp. NST-5]|uniref:EamA family transporter n=1 Tax=Flavobacterium ichthyis TaxID=2698827 RepID=A0ABW9ZAV1_9FLAO|nr:DMT family transporter [Flavobacterium ichthyis]NBL66053.1 EamA family transporter [Flavobacterium ichthyis]